MSTELKRVSGGYIVSTVSAPGSRKKLPRNAVRLDDPDKAALVAEIVKQADAARTKLGIRTKREDPVV